MPRTRDRAGKDVPMKIVRVRGAKKPLPQKEKLMPQKIVDTSKESAPKQKKKQIKKKSAAVVHIPIKADVKQSRIAVHHPVTTVKSRSLAILSPFRFPIDNVHLASQVARYAGVTFVVVGALFALFNLHFITADTNSQLSLRFPDLFNMRAAMLNFQEAECFSPGSPYFSLSECQQLRETECSNSGSPYYATQECLLLREQQVLDTSPDAQFNVEKDSPVQGMTPINVTVPLADKVVLYAYHKQLGQPFLIGEMIKIGNIAWRIYWETADFPDGDYRIKAKIFNEYYSTGYDKADTVYTTVENNPAQVAGANEITPTTGTTETGDVTGTTGTGDITGTTETGDVTGTTGINNISNNVDIDLAVNKSMPLKDIVSVKVDVNGASKVKISIRPDAATKDMLLGYAVYDGSNTWKFDWNTKNNPNGKYTLIAQALVSEIYHSRSMDVTVKNEFTTNLSTTTPQLTTTQEAATATTTTTAYPSTTETTAIQTLPPPLSFKIPEAPTLSDTADIFFSISGASFIEIYALPKGGLTPRFLGLAKQQSNGIDWRFVWYTDQVPNGEYAVYGKIKSAFGYFETPKYTVTVKNEVATILTSEQQTYVEKLEETQKLTEETTAETMPIEQHTDATDELPTNPVPPAPVTVSLSEFIADFQTDETERAELEIFNSTFKAELDDIISRYAKAVRNEDTAGMERSREEMEILKKQIIADLPVSPDRADIISRIEEYLARTVKDQTELVERNERIIRDRIGNAITADSDTDGVSDYDEVNLYQTDPFSADTDKDGFTDAVEIEGGYDPRDSVRETLVVYESPKETGIVRDDILAVHSVFSVNPETGAVDTDGVPQTAILTGKGLPNSFVTLYIFSTPIVVTVKTDENGAWSYVFDKELEDGEHEVYAAITDNAGRMVAKSNPFTFVKTAEAFTPIDAAAESSTLATTDVQPSFMSVRALLVAGSLIVIVLGLVLILLGLHVRQTKPEPIALAA